MKNPNGYKHIIVWNCTFCKVDDDGNTMLNDDGTVKQFDAHAMDWSHIAEYVEHDDLVEVENEKP